MQDSFQNKAEKEIQKIAALLKAQGLNVTTADKKLYNYEIKVVTKQDSLKVLVYFGKKGLKTLIQGNAESKFFKEVYNLIYGENLFGKDDVANLNKDVKFDIYIGTDESGKGDYFGPLVIAAVYVDEVISKELEKIGVKDSKLLTDERIKTIEPIIKKVVKDKFDIVIVNPEKYNQLYESFKNLNKILAWAHSKTIENVLSKIKCDNVISDKFGNESLIKNELKKKNIEVNLYQTTKAERYTAVAAASILARAKVVDWFNQNSKELGFKLPKGGGVSVTNAANRVLNQFNEEYLLKLIKFHFKNSQSLIKR